MISLSILLYNSLRLLSASLAVVDVRRSLCFCSCVCVCESECECVLWSELVQSNRNKQKQRKTDILLFWLIYVTVITRFTNITHVQICCALRILGLYVGLHCRLSSYMIDCNMQHRICWPLTTFAVRAGRRLISGHPSLQFPGYTFMSFDTLTLTLTLTSDL